MDQILAKSRSIRLIIILFGCMCSAALSPSVYGADDVSEASVYRETELLVLELERIRFITLSEGRDGRGGGIALLHGHLGAGGPWAARPGRNITKGENVAAARQAQVCLDGQTPPFQHRRG